ncbi:MAG: PfkB family carbohydrate kinase [Thermoplasmata archaeon]
MVPGEAGGLQLETRSPGRDLLVVGHTNLDRFLSVADFPGPDRTVPVLGQRTVLGGTAANIARSAAAWGVPTGLLSRVGKDFPSGFLRQMAAEGIDLRGVEIVPDAPSPTCFIVQSRLGNQRTMIDQGPMGDAADAPISTSLVKEYSWVHLTTGDPVYQLRVADVARRLGLRVAADPAQEIHFRWSASQLRALLENSEILFGNVAEAKKATSLMGLTTPAALTKLVPLVIVTDGPRGATAYDRRGVQRVRAAPSRRGTSRVGAGDAFRGGFYAAWFAGESLEHCLKAGTRSAARWIQKGGPERAARTRSKKPPRKR